MAKILYYDASCGISGDMNLGALVGLGVDFGYLCTELEKLNLAGEFKLERKNVLKNGIAATKIDVVCAANPSQIPLGLLGAKFSPRQNLNGKIHSAEFRADKPAQNHPRPRNFTQILELIESSSLSTFVKKTASEIFSVIARAEAKIHGTSVGQVHFHEVGAADSIADVVGAAICLEALGAPQIFTSPIELGGGVAICDHGALSVPAPAVCEILKGVPVSLGRANFEMTTPTGAAILKACADEFTDGASFKIEKIGYGAGERDAAGFANVLRAMICEADLSGESDKSNLGARAGYGEVCKQILISTNIDDMDAESFAFACEILRENGALDVFSRSIFMKKGRAGFELNALCREQDAQNLKDLIFTHTTAIGVREIEVAKTELKREFVRVQTKFGEIGLKISGSGQTQKAKPEFEDCKAAALAHGTTIERVRKEALEIYDETRKTKG
ncbi:nickel pincer cofactor biosynthesis protein LarC [uncultured Campylobacter sp.]|uniref:nickel pincer cofactor biosynthesis protein LarC n=1 Tax=uncultured Campylobacter sp. TaxID=218934 RepID=UPI0026052168|nr:nickel pincer cofactor biosynthesis protein LarC [uncultured Campylobacter sp.]